MSGIDVNDDLLSMYESIKKGRAHKYAIFSLVKTGQTGTKVTYDWSIDFKAPPADDDKNKDSFKEMVNSLSADKTCFVVFDFTDVRDDGRQIKKLVLIKWCPDNAPLRDRAICGSTYQTLKEKLTGLGADVQAADTSDLEYSAIFKQLA